MHIEKWIIAHFSPTGGTKKVADAIAAGFNTPVVELDLTQENPAITLGENDALWPCCRFLRAVCLRFLWSGCPA